jgi:hypothetical protein
MNISGAFVATFFSALSVVAASSTAAVVSMPLQACGGCPPRGSHPSASNLTVTPAEACLALQVQTSTCSNAEAALILGTNQCTDALSVPDYDGDSGGLISTGGSISLNPFPSSDTLTPPAGHYTVSGTLGTTPIVIAFDLAYD